MSNEVSRQSVTAFDELDKESRLETLEVSLRQRELELKEAQRIARLGTFHWDFLKDKVTWSSEVFLTYGIEPNQEPPRGEESRKLHTPESWGRLIAAIERTRATGEPYVLDLQMLPPDGALRWVAIRGEVAGRGPNGEVNAIRGTVQNITERKLQELELAERELAERELAERERQLQEAQRIARLGTWSWDATTDKVEWSEEVFRAFGVDPALGAPGFETIRAMHSEESADRLSALVERAMKTGAPYTYDMEVRPPGGRRQWILSRGEVASRGPNGEVTGLRGTIQDITERKEAEEQLRRANQRLEAVLSGMTDGLSIRDREGRYSYFNEQGARITGVDREEVVGRIAWEVFPGTRNSKFNLETQRALETGQPVHFEELSPNGRWLECHCYPYDDNIWVYFRDVTEKRQADAALQASQSRFQRLYESNLMGMCYPDRFGVFHDGNDEFLRIVGYSREELEAGLVRWDTMTPPEYASLDVEHIAEAARLGSCTPYEKEYIRKDGTRVPIVCGYALLEGSTDQYIGFISDLTAQKVAERAQRESQARFQKLYDSDLIGVGFPGPDGSIPEGNDALLRIIGYTRQDMEAGLVRWDAMTPPEYRELDQLHRAEAAEFGRCTPYEKEYIRKDGSRVPILCGFARLSGEEQGSIGFVMDLSAQKRAEQAVREREMQFRQLAESLPQLVWASDVNGDRVYANQRYADYTGVSEANLLGRMWRNLLHPDDLERTNRLWAQCTATGEPYLNEYRIRRYDGLYRSFLVRAVPVRNAEGEIERWLGSATDIHDQKLAEEALRRTEKLAAAGRLAATIAHEINNPLAAVTNSLFLALMDETLNETTRSYLNMAEQELARAAHVTTQTLQFHRQTSAPAVVALSGVMDSAISLFSTRFRTCQIEVQLEYGEKTELFCCGDELRQVFANLLSNALDAMRTGGRVRVRIRLEHAWDAARTPGIRVSVGDTGVGIPAEVRPRVFEPFLSTKEATGTGLGLWVSQNIVQKHKGRIQLHSSEAGERRGTVFSLFLPLEGLPR